MTWLLVTWPLCFLAGMAAMSVRHFRAEREWHRELGRLRHELADARQAAWESNVMADRIAERLADAAPAAYRTSAARH